MLFDSMLPVLFTIGSFKVYTFGFFLALSFILSTFIIWKYAKEDLKEEEYLDAFLYTSIAALVSARLLYIMLNFEEFGLNILRYIVVREAPGLSLLGGLSGGFTFFYWYAKQKRLDFSHLLDLFSVAACFALSFAKIGEQLAGGAFGRETNFFLSVKVVGAIGRYHPVELYESFLFLLLAILLLLIYNKIRLRKLPKGLAFSLFTLGAVLVVFLLEFMKVHSVYLYGLSFNQIIAILIIIVLLKPLIDQIKAIIFLKKEKKG